MTEKFCLAGAQPVGGKPPGSGGQGYGGAPRGAGGCWGSAVPLRSFKPAAGS